MTDAPTISIDQTAKEVINDLATADAEQAQAVLDAESEKEQPRSTVIAAAEARLDELAPVVDAEAATGTGTVLEDIPDRAWAQLLDGDGEPVLVDGNPVETELVP